ncbi:MAG: TetR/AcrR family transcriptional regulator [Chromatiales bacterium]|nr:TetR/AcrR family transcriptional regulator [Chromatiales bacterium]
MTKKRTRAKQALVDAAMVLLANNPGASFIEVAENAGVGRATLYRHFPTREALLKELTLDAIHAMDQARAHIMEESSSATDALRLTIEAIIPLGDRFYFLTRFPELEDEEIAEHTQRQNAELETIIRSAQEEGDIDDKLPAVWVASVFNSLVYAAWKQIEEEAIPESDASALVLRTLLHGLSPLK